MLKGSKWAQTNQEHHFLLFFPQRFAISNSHEWCSIEVTRRRQITHFEDALVEGEARRWLLQSTQIHFSHIFF